MTQTLFGDLPKFAGGTKANLSGRQFEDDCAARFRELGYSVKKQVVRIPSVYGTGHKHIDILVVDIGLAVSCKWQKSSGSAEEKLWGELVHLQHLVNNNDDLKMAWILLGGDGFTQVDYWRKREWLRWVMAFDVSVYRLNEIPLPKRMI